MAKAKIILPDGTKVDIDGGVKEISALMDMYSKRSGRTISDQRSITRVKRKTKEAAKPKRKGQTFYITELVDEGYFRSKRTLSDVQKKLEERGYFYNQDGISPILRNMVKRRVIRRIRSGKRWVYIN